MDAAAESLLDFESANRVALHVMLPAFGIGSSKRKNPASEEDGVFEMREEKKMRLADLAATDFPAS